MKTEGEGARSAGFSGLDMVVLSVLFFIGLWGCLSMYNCGACGENPFYFAGRQFIWLFIGLAGLYFSASLPYSFYRDFAPFIALAAYIPLWLVLRLGIEVNGMKGWFVLGPVFVQPSEFAKVPFLMLMCFLAGRGGGESRRFILMLILCIVWIVPILLQPDMGTALIYMVAFGIVYWCSGGKIRYLFYSLPVACPFLFFFIYRHPYILSRFYGFWDPEGDFSGKGWHIMQFRYTLSRGGLAGAESGRALWANSYLPLAHSDSAFASLVESVGLIGSLPVVAGIMVLCYIAFRAACLGGDAMRGNLIFSIAAVFAFQSLVHIGVNVTLLPPTGITLPILSYGGSSLVSTMVAFGIMLSAARGNNYSALRLRNG